MSTKKNIVSGIDPVSILLGAAGAGYGGYKLAPKFARAIG